MQLKFFKILLIWLFVHAVTTGFSGDSLHFESYPEQVFELIYNFEFDKAEQMIQTGKINENIKNILKTDLLWWRAIAGNSDQAMEQFNKQLKQNSGSSLYWATPEGEILYKTYKVRYQLAGNNYLSAFFTYSSLRNILNDFHPDKYNEGLAGAEILQFYKESMQLLETRYLKHHFSKNARNIIQSTLTRFEGYAAGENPILQTLSAYFLYKYYTEIETDEVMAAPFCTDLHKRYPQNTVFKELKNQTNIQLTIH